MEVIISIIVIFYLPPLVDSCRSRLARRRMLYRA